MTRPPLPTPAQSRQAFSLVEVALAVAILGFAVVALMGLLPVGMHQFRSGMDTSIAAQIAQRLLHDAGQAEFDELIDRANLPGPPEKNPHFTFRAPRVKEPALRYFDAQGLEIVPRQRTRLSEEEARAVVYFVNQRIMPRAPVPNGRQTGSSEVAQVTIQVVRAASAASLKFHAGRADDANAPERNLLQPAPGTTTHTHAALIGKNQGR